MNTKMTPDVGRDLRNHATLSFIRRPLHLITARFNRRNAVFIVMLCIPAIVVTALLTLPHFLFNTPQHNEYFEFAKQLDQGGGRWLAMGMSACCNFLCFAVPDGEQADAAV